MFALPTLLNLSDPIEKSMHNPNEVQAENKRILFALMMMDLVLLAVALPF